MYCHTERFHRMRNCLQFYHPANLNLGYFLLYRCIHKGFAGTYAALWNGTVQCFEERTCVKLIKQVLKKILKQLNNHTLHKRCIVGSNTVFGMNARCICEQTGSIAVGSNCRIEGSLITQNLGKIQLGNNVTIRYETKIGAVSRITIGNNVIISNHVTIYDNNNHPTDVADRRKICADFDNEEVWKWKYSRNAPIVINDDVWIGQGAVILKGVTIGKGSIVGMNAVVTKDVPPYSIAAGNPARVVKRVDRE